MSMNLENFDSETRPYMLKEVDLDVSKDNLYRSPRLSTVGWQDYEGLLREAIEKHDIPWLANELRAQGRLNATEERRKPSGGTTTVKVRIDAPDMLAEGEINRFYARGLCLRAIEEGIPEVQVYRAKEVSKPRTASKQLIGTKLAVAALLEDLRKSIGVDTALGLPPGPNSGISVKLV